jgi:hypothetical protein
LQVVEVVLVLLLAAATAEGDFGDGGDGGSVQLAADWRLVGAEEIHPIPLQFVAGELLLERR